MPSLLAHWPLNGDLLDVSGHGRHLSEVGTLAWVDGPDPRRQAVQVTNGNRATLADDDALDPGAADGIAVLAWLRFPVPSSFIASIVDKKNLSLSAGDAGWRSYVIGSSGTGASLISDGTTRAFVFAGGYGGSAWTQYIGELDRSIDQMRLWRDESLVDDVENDGPVSAIGSLANSEQVIVGDVIGSDVMELAHVQVYDGPTTFAERRKHWLLGQGSTLLARRRTAIGVI